VNWIVPVLTAEDRIARKAAEQRTFQARFGLFLLTVCSLLGAEKGGDLKY
jgi:hypothetical protein